MLTFGAEGAIEGGEAAIYITIIKNELVFLIQLVWLMPYENKPLCGKTGKGLAASFDGAATGLLFASPLSLGGG